MLPTCKACSTRCWKTNARPAERDITYGTCGYYDGWYAQKGWDPCTGNGSSVGQAGKWQATFLEVALRAGCRV